MSRFALRPLGLTLSFVGVSCAAPAPRPAGPAPEYEERPLAPWTAPGSPSALADSAESAAAAASVPSANGELEPPAVASGVLPAVSSTEPPAATLSNGGGLQ